MIPALVLALALLVPPTPHFVSATPLSGNWTGYQAQVQMRAVPLDVEFVWVGGHLADGMFVQSGLQLGKTTYAFAWATRDLRNDSPVPLDWAPLPSAPGPWYTFTLAKSGCVWAFSYVTPAGRTVKQGSFRDCANLTSAQATTEYWATGPENLGVTVIRNWRLRTTAGKWTVPPDVQWSGDRHETLTSATPGNVVFRGSDGTTARTWARLW